MGSHINTNVIDVAHNYARSETHFGKTVFVHRKGATYAGPNAIELIPGSQGTRSYVVRGLDKPESFMSCSHGAGRKMSRRKAWKTLNIEEEIAKMDALGIVHSIRTSSDLYEAASAYKDIDEVMRHQADLVEIVTELTPLGVIKA